MGKAPETADSDAHAVRVVGYLTAGSAFALGLDGLIGRDVLQHFTMTYNGKTGRVTMKYHKPTT